MIKNKLKPLLVAGLVLCAGSFSLTANAAEKAATATAGQAKTEYVIRVTGVPKRDVAKALASDLGKKMRVGALLNNEDGSFRVFLGPVPTPEQADFLLKKVKKEGYAEADILSRPSTTS